MTRDSIEFCVENIKIISSLTRFTTDQNLKEKVSGLTMGFKSCTVYFFHPLHSFFFPSFKSYNHAKQLFQESYKPILFARNLTAKKCIQIGYIYITTKTCQIDRGRLYRPIIIAQTSPHCYSLKVF